MTDTMRAITLMVFAMFLFTVADLFVKLASQSLSPWLVVFLMGFGTASVFLIALWVSGQKIYKSSYLHWTVFLRLVGEVIAALAIIAALSVVPLATVTAVLQSQPLLLTAAGALFLGEKVGPRRTFAVLLGFIGVMVIMRPTQDGFTIFSMLVLLSVVGMTIRDVGSRIVPAHIPTLVIAFYGASAVAVVGGIMMVVSNQLYLPQGVVWSYVIIMVLAAASGVYCITNAMRLGELSVVSPFRYVKIIFGIAAGMMVLGERPDLMTWIGAGIVTGAGLYAFIRERTLIRAQSQTNEKQT